MELCETRCCAVEEIAHLSDHDNAKDAMRAFCDRIWGDVNDPYFEGLAQDVYGFYTFTAVVSDGEHYGQDFASFIRRNKLGKVTGTHTALNRVNHPDHRVKIWAWSPAPAALRRWYKATGRNQ